MVCSFYQCFTCFRASRIQKITRQTLQRLNTFDPIAGFYDALADTFFLGRIFRAQTRYFDYIKPGSKVLILGGGTGRILGPLYRQQPGIKVCYIEASAAMLRKSRERLTGREEVFFIHGTEEALPNERFDVIILPFFVDMFEEPDLMDLCTKLISTSTGEAVWLVSDFVDSRLWQRSVLFVMYRFFNLLCKVKPRRLPPWKKLLRDLVGK